ncbi:hypothetical protein G7Y89_g13250 [Cudoniella acicularis]|uniref:DUF6594 domain-containing protein n=1 Tax=Cudoniella acicularis TaxID=354080 RepID=A0A8H4R9P4_9HELO|nr:hypothetical protein G7Y89_g13250 [Cudoniella acicularis]
MANSMPLQDLHSPGNGFLITDFSPAIELSLQRPESVYQPVQTYDTNHSPSRLESARDLPNARSRKSRQIFDMFAPKRSRIPDNRDENLVPINLERHVKGYPQVAAYINSTDDTVLFRRFGDLRARTLLYKEVRLTALEAKLAKLDKEDKEKDVTAWRVAYSIDYNGGKRNEERKALIEEIDVILKEYDELLLRDSQIRRLGRPSQRVHRNFMDWIWTQNSIGPADREFIFHEHDFVSLENYEDSWLDNLMHRFMSYCKKGVLRRIFVTDADAKKTTNKKVHYYSSERLNATIKILIAVTSATLLLIPIFLFLSINLTPKTMAALTLAFSFVFATIISVTTTATRQEVFAGTAAYCAVLVVFIGNLQQKQWGPSP